MSNREMTRRQLILHSTQISLAGALGVSLPRMVSAAGNKVELTEDGLHYQPWFLESFLELADDVSEAAEKNKHLAIMWELKGCPYCEETHLVNFADEKIRNFIIGNFEILQLNIIGSKRVTDFDGEELSEKDLARKYGVRFTPTFQFFPKTIDALADSLPQKREVARLPGYMRPDHFLLMFKYVAEEAYINKDFKTYLQNLSG
ncbi:SoxW family protein [Sneathiella aquimaris]|uniref:SoxW family protein n=1 Tax=Sneathiella aquimaris TaxID=2599305 RepID=UPI002260873B|nr:thioredoxin family protein [Sneathiella aquimaris]